MGKKYKIIQFLGGLDQGGAESVIRDYALELTKRGHEVEIPLFYTTPDMPNQIALEEAGVRIDVFRGYYSRNKIKRLYNKILTLVNFDEIKLGKLIKEFKPDIIHIHGYTLGCFKHLDKELEGIKLFYTCHSTPSEFFEGAWRKQYQIAQRLIADHNLQMIALHREMAEELNSMFNIDNTKILNNPICLDRFTSDKLDKAFLKRQYGIASDAFVVGHVGRFDALKNHMLLLDIFYEIQKVKPEAFLLLVAASGGDTYCEVIDKIRRLGIGNKTMIMLDRKDMPEIYKIMDVFIFPSKIEGFGLALLEAQASGIKCLVSEKIPESAIVKKNVFRINLDADIEEWVEMAINKNDSYVSPKGKIEDYSINHVTDCLERIYGLKSTRKES